MLFPSTTTTSLYAVSLFSILFIWRIYGSGRRLHIFSRSNPSYINPNRLSLAIRICLSKTSIDIFISSGMRIQLEGGPSMLSGLCRCRARQILTFSNSGSIGSQKGQRKRAWRSRTSVLCTVPTLVKTSAQCRFRKTP